MTLIVALRSPEGAVIAADSQETIETGKRKNIFRYTVQKITPERIGNFTVVIAGAGDGELIDAFQERLRSTMPSASIDSLKDFKSTFESELSAFYKSDGAMYGKRRIALVVGARSHPESKFELWRTAGSRLVRINQEPYLVGFDEYLYKHVAGELYRPTRHLGQNVLIAVRILELARQTSRYIDRPYSVVIFRDANVWTEKVDFISQVIERTEMFGAQVSDLFVSMMDLSSPPSEFAAKLREFEATVSELRTDYRIETAKIMFPNQDAVRTYDSPYLHLASGMTFEINADGSLHFLENITTQITGGLEEMEKFRQSVSRKTKLGQ